MKKIQFIPLIIVILSVATTGYFYYINKSVDIKQIDLSSTSFATSTIKIDSFTNSGTPESSTSTTPYISSIEITIEYPQFSNLSSSTKLFEEKRALNTKLKDAADSLYKKATDDQNKTLVALEKFHQDEPESFKWRLITDQRIYTDKNYINDQTGIFSYVTKSYTDMAGAHGMFFYTSNSYDLASGNKIGISELLKGEYKSFLLQYLKNSIEKKSPDCLRCENLSSLYDIEAQYVTFDNFVLSNEGITFLFSAYDLGAYAETAAGNELFVPKEVLKEYIQKDW